MSLFWLTTLAIVSLWIFVSLATALSLGKEVCADTWHLRLLQSYDDDCYPETKCAYFKHMLFVPIKLGAKVFGSVIFFVLVVFFRIATDWIVKPIEGEYAANALKKEYWKELVAIDEHDFERSNISYAEFPFKRFSFLFIILIAVLFWLTVFYFSYQSCKTGHCTRAALAVMLPSFVLLLLGFVALIRFIVKSITKGIKKTFIAAKDSDWWKMLTGKFCETLTYKD